MSAAPTSDHRHAQELLATAERLFAEHGLEGVSLRQIAVEAGSANNSAVQYHFGSKEALIEAIFAFRLGQLLQRRALLRARLAEDDLRGRLEAHVVPLLELAESPDSSYVSFVEAIERTDSTVLAEQREVLRSQDEFLVDMRRLLHHIPEPARSLRIAQAQVLCLHVAAERERAVRRGGDLVPFGLFVSGVVDGFTGFLAAPASTETVRHAAAQPLQCRPGRAAPTGKQMTDESAEHLRTAAGRGARVLRAHQHNAAPAGHGRYFSAGVIGFVFGEMWRRGVLAPRDRRWITLCCVGAADAAFPIESHVWAALNSGDISWESSTSSSCTSERRWGWPKGSVMNMYGMKAQAKLAEKRGETMQPADFVRWTDPVDDATRAPAAKPATRGVRSAAPERPPSSAATPTSTSSTARSGPRCLPDPARPPDHQHLLLGCRAADAEVRDHLRAALELAELTYDELQALVEHYAVYVGWPLGRHLDDLLVEVAAQLRGRDGDPAESTPIADLGDASPPPC